MRVLYDKYRKDIIEVSMEVGQAMLKADKIKRFINLGIKLL